MATCQNCESFVTRDYVRVFTPDDIDEPRVCPHCEDLIRDTDGTAREKRS